MELTIDCQPRPEGSKPNSLRRAGQLPAVLYGHKGAESIALTIPMKKAELMLRDASLNNTLIQVNIPELSWSGKALLREVQTHPWRGTPYHISFFAVSAQDSLEVDVPLHFVGTARGIKEGGGSLDPSMSSLHVKCAPDSIPEQIEIDVSDLGAGEALHIGDINLPAGVVALGDANRVVVSVLSGRGGGEEAAEG
ncbi:MAG: 50S ribosomal protein L25/general stress protein Ctc [Leptodesmis sp.]|uniref:50S ribosomal protein L25/general stress protein Ctc n=1 Tax=Leptodesmis TaxID=2664261 RepID=UPI001F15ACA3|nr:50S ribosomal protein L25/general stress protein Ctc [Leptodesmis sichuanensis]UIE39438.1 50S ribosomal protein L25/general stress protein Ctc [Leptodesmis sichuanensis A121]